MPQIRLGYNTNTLYTCMEPRQALDFIAELGLRFVEFGAIPESTYMMWGESPQDFREYFEGLSRYAQSIGLSVPVVSSWVRDNRDVTSLDPCLNRAGCNILKCLIDLGEIFGAERMMSPAGTIRGYRTTEEREARFRNMIDAWNEAAVYAKGKVKALEVEQMSWRDDPPQTIEQAAQMLDMFDAYRDNHDAVPVFLRYDIGHGPTPPVRTGTHPEYNPVVWFGRFPSRMVGAHLKGFDYRRTNALPLMHEPSMYLPSSEEIVRSLLSAIESIPGIIEPDYFDVVMEIGHLKERAHTLSVQLDEIRETVDVAKDMLRRCGYRESEGTWSKDS